MGAHRPLQEVSASPFTSSAFLFLHLPLDIQHQVCSLFCRHCQCQGQPSAPSITLSEAAGVHFSTLKALSETCLALNKIAQPMLYHYPDVKTYTPFFKTVTARPALAASVRVLARLYESDWSWRKRDPQWHSKEDFAYLIELAKGFGLNDNVDENVEYWAKDDANFKRCFAHLEECEEGDQQGYTMDLAHQSYFSLLITLHFAILPKLEFAMIDLYDGTWSLGQSTFNNGQLTLPYPYLPQIVAANPGHFAHLDTVVFRNSYHYRQDSLGLERIAFLFPVLPNVRTVFFQSLRGENQEEEEYPEVPSCSSNAELNWSALAFLEEIYFDPCARLNTPVPLLAISSMIQRCSRLKKLIYRHKYPDQFNPTLFSPAGLFEVILSAKDTLLHLEIYCHHAKIPSFPCESLLDFRLKSLALLTTLVLDEELFCQHWLFDGHANKDESYSNICLISILPNNISSLTVRLHDKFKAVVDIIRLGKEVALGHYHSQLSHLQVYVIHDVTGPADPYNLNQDPDAFDSEYFLYAVEPEGWKETLRALAETIRPTIAQAFAATDVAVKVEYRFEALLSSRRTPFR